MQPTRIEISPFCVHLCSKQANFLQRPPVVAEDLLDASRAVWCSRTMEAVGPDDRLANPEGCRRERTCFEAYGAAPPRTSNKANS